jgi:hypothetical protein|tara:strand:- start:2147 stop:2329 length:183 start_codon:yes stop_codon:yes gene_type:complete
MSLKDKFDVWLEDVKDKVHFTFQRDKIEKDKLYETRWVWYHTVLVVELFIIIILLWYIAL